MRCRPGDIASIVGSVFAGGRYNGCLVRCIEIDHPGAWEVEVLSPRLLEVIDPEQDAVADEYLRPIRPGDVSDEEVSSLYQSNPTKQGEHA